MLFNQGNLSDYKNYTGHIQNIFSSIYTLINENNDNNNEILLENRTSDGQTDDEESTTVVIVTLLIGQLLAWVFGLIHACPFGY